MGCHRTYLINWGCWRPIVSYQPAPARAKMTCNHSCLRWTPIQLWASNRCCQSLNSTIFYRGQALAPIHSSYAKKVLKNIWWDEIICFISYRNLFLRLKIFCRAFENQLVKIRSGFLFEALSEKWLLRGDHFRTLSFCNLSLEVQR